ncbi:transcription initiation factor IID, TAF10 subunit [Rhodotorula sp. JG-1b]|nr:transcription initiation factor IID, TAF10 subunit [Rhodotorula sp. JG-1b]
MNPNDLFLRAHANKADPSSATTTASGDPTPEQLSLLFKLDQQHNRQQRAQRDHDQQDAQLAQLLDQMDDYKPIIPDEVTDYYLQRAGFDTSDVRVKRLVGLAAQRFISSIASDAFQYARARTAAGPGGGRTTTTAAAAAATAATTAGTSAAGAASSSSAAAPAPGTASAAPTTASGTGKAKGRQRTVLTMEDLSAALKEYGVDASRAPYYL